MINNTPVIPIRSNSRSENVSKFSLIDIKLSLLIQMYGGFLDIYNKYITRTTDTTSKVIIRSMQKLVWKRFLHGPFYNVEIGFTSYPSNELSVISDSYIVRPLPRRKHLQSGGRSGRHGGKLHTPASLYANITPITPDKNAEITEIFACDLKSMLIVRIAC